MNAVAADPTRAVEQFVDTTDVSAPSDGEMPGAPVLLGAFRGREIKLGPGHRHTIDSLRELVDLYESWGKPDEAAKWRAKLPGEGSRAP